MSNPNPADVVDRLCAAINHCDIETAMTLYEPEAAFVAQPGNVVIGTKALRDALAGFIALKPTITTEAHRLIQAGDVALYCSKWNLRGTDPQGKALWMEGRSADVLRRQPGGVWLIAIDNPWGAEILPEAK